MTEIRCLHLDMKSLFPTAEYLLKTVEQLAELGYTHLLFEFEDLFPFEAFPEFVRPYAYSKDDFRRIDLKCRELGLKIIPLLQSAGHLDYFLKEKPYRHLQENHNSYQWCLSDPESFEVWKTMAGEILAVFPECEYFHIGADEVHLKDPCPRCKGKDAFQIYAGRIRECVRFMVEHGKKVLMWDDMFRNHDLAVVGDLLEFATPCVWQYRKIDEAVIKRYADRRIAYWGASRIQTNDEIFRGMGRQFLMQKNVDDWADIEAKYPSCGHIGTVWGRIQSLYPINTTLPQAMYMAAYQSHTLKYGKITDRSKFNREFAESFFGLPEMDMDTLVRWFGIEPEPVREELEKFLGKAQKNNDILEIWYMFNEIDALYAYVDYCFGHNNAAKPKFSRGFVNQAQINNWLDGVRITRERSEKLIAELRKVLPKYFPRESLEEFIEERFSSMFEQNEAWGTFLAGVNSRPHI